MSSRSLVLAGVAAVVMTVARPTVARAEDAASVIRQRSQAFPDASATGNASELARYLDDAVVFVDENGDVGTKKDIVDNPGSPPAGVTNVLKQTEFQLAIHGSVAVTAFVDVATTNFHGQMLNERFRSTEVWLDEAGTWLMISSQTIALNQDPPAMTLPNATLDDYVGTYRAAPDYAVAIAHVGSGLTASVNGSTPVAMKAEVRDVFFVPGQPRSRRIFERDAGGAITGYVSRREGHDVALRRIG